MNVFKFGISTISNFIINRLYPKDKQILCEWMYVILGEIKF